MSGTPDSEKRKRFVLGLAALLLVFLVGSGTAWYTAIISTKSEPSIVYDRNGEIVARLFSNEDYGRAPYFVSHILFNDLLPTYGAERVYAGGLRIYTTIDLALQEKAQEVVQSLRTQSALVCLEAETGEVLVLVGGKDFQESKFNRATQAFRQPGSSFKAIVFAAALENDIMPTDHFIDRPVIKKLIRGGPPGCMLNEGHGRVTVLQALSYSYNIVAVKAAAYIGTQPIVNMSRSMGITSEHLPNDLSIAMGTASVTPLEMAVAFNCFNNGGKRTAPIMIREIRAPDGSVLLSNESKPAQAIKPETAYVLRSILSDVIRAGTGTRAKLANSVEAFGKTGTSNDWIDAWFIGGAPGLTTAVYVGNDDHTSLRSVYGRGASASTGGHVAAPVWKTFMDFAVARMKTPDKFAPPPAWIEVERISICRATGFKSRQGCRAVPLFMPSGKAPRAECPTHGGDYYAASEDPNAPRLFLIEQDDYYEPEQVDIPVLEPRSDASSPADVIEERYQRLLREYGIK